MIVYEKNNKLNINFENDLDNPDIEIGKGEINVDGNNIVNGGGGGGNSDLFVVTFGQTESDEPELTADKTYSEIIEAMQGGKIVVFNIFGLCSFVGRASTGELSAYFYDYMAISADTPSYTVRVVNIMPRGEIIVHEYKVLVNVE